ncbi:MAG: hypothetical protein LDL41_04390 [Coleofasciculus sp. S288]|nr:hypothetical protein [Coleofasciculus sp. S288]
MQRYSYSMPQPLSTVQQNSLNQAVVVGNTLLGSLAILLFSGLVLGAILRKRYRTYRASTLCQQIETLERMWRLPSKKPKSPPEEGASVN